MYQQENSKHHYRISVISYRSIQMMMYEYDLLKSSISFYKAKLNVMIIFSIGRSTPVVAELRALRKNLAHNGDFATNGIALLLRVLFFRFRLP